jgi:hypothetical protein
MTPATPAGSPPPREPNDDLARSRLEFIDPEQRTLLWSYAISAGLAIIWLIIVGMYKAPPPSLLPPDESVTINLEPEKPAPPPPAVEPPVATSPTENRAAGPKTPEPKQIASTGPRNLPAGRRGPKGNPRPGPPGSRTETNSSGAIGTAFGTGSGAGTGGLVGDVSGILRGVAVANGSGGTGGGQGGRGGGGAGGKSVLGYGQGGEGGVRPGRGGFGGGSGTGGGGGGGGIGGVGSGGGGGGISKAAVRVSGVRPIATDNLGGPSRDVGELGAFVRSRESQLRFCYVEYGLKANPSLAGTITVAITLTGSGSVTNVDVTNRTWGGAGASEAESCVRSKIQAWKFPSSAAGGGTYSFPFNFTH